MHHLVTGLVYCVVGCNGGAPDGSSLRLMAMNPLDGEAQIVQSVPDIQGTTYFQIDPVHSRLLSIATATGGETQSRAVSVAIARDDAGRRQFGAVSTLSTLPCEPPCHLAYSPSGEIAFAAYGSATVGRLRSGDAAVEWLRLPDDGMGPRADRQQKAFAHCAFWTPDGSLLGFVDLGCDKIHFFAAGKPLVKPLFALSAEPGDGPRHVVFARDGRFMYVVNELSSTVTGYALAEHPRCAADFRRIGRYSMLPADCRLAPTETKAAAIKLTCDGKLLMASNRGDDSIAFFAVAEDGSLTLRNVAKLRGRFPRDFELAPGERFMVVGHKMSDEIQIYAFDREHCTLTPVGRPIACHRPLCFKFLP